MPGQRPTNIKKTKDIIGEDVEKEHPCIFLVRA